MKSRQYVYTGGAIIIIAVVLLLFKYCGKEKEQNRVVDNSGKHISKGEVKQFINPPFNNLNIPFHTYSLNADDSSELVYESGTVLNIPKSAFLDKNGNLITGAVKLDYREWHSPVDVFLSGIPMNYGDSNSHLSFESAGMCEIVASANGQQVYPNPANKIKISMVSNTTDTSFNTYTLDTVKDIWVIKGKQEVMKLSKEAELVKRCIPVPPAPKVADDHAFTVNDSAGGTDPELAEFKNVMFEPLSGDYCGRNATSIKIKKITQGIFDVIFYVDYAGKRYSETHCKCSLAFKRGADYSLAMETYRKKYEPILKAKEEMEKRIDEEWAVYTKAVNEYNEKVKKYNEAVGIYNAQFLSNSEKIDRVFYADGFGVINCDCPASCPQGATLAAKFQDIKGNPIAIAQPCLIEIPGKTIYRYWDGNVRFNPSHLSCLWGVTADDQLAYMRADDFKNVTATSGSYTFKMKMIAHVSSREEIEKVLMGGM